MGRKLPIHTMQKYSEANVLAIKRDIQKYTAQLVSIIREIESKKIELQSLAIEVSKQHQAKELLSERVNNFFFRKRNDIADLVEKEEAKKDLLKNLDNTIKQLSTSRDVLISQIAQQSKEIPEIAGVSLVESAIKQLGDKLDSIKNQVDVSSSEKEDLEKNKDELTNAVKQLQSDYSEQENKVVVAKQELIDIEKQRNQILNELTKEQITLEQIKIRDHDSAVMYQRLQKEYREVYQSLTKAK